MNHGPGPEQARTPTVVGYTCGMTTETTPDHTPVRGCGPLTPMYDEALAWAGSLHRDQLRKNTRVPYLAHLLAVSSLVLEDGGTETEAIAGLLHDAIEDIGAQIESVLRHRFGDAVVNIVLECSDAAPVDGTPKAAWPIRKQAYVDRIRRTVNDSALRVSAADKLHNARATLGDLEQSNRIGTWAPHNACCHQSLWYYQAISEAVTRQLPTSRTGVELANVVTQLYRQTNGGLRQPTEAQQLVPACPNQPPCDGAAQVP